MRVETHIAKEGSSLLVYLASKVTIILFFIICYAVLRGLEPKSHKEPMDLIVRSYPRNCGY